MSMLLNADVSASDGGNILLGLQVLAIGMAAVFSVLIVIWIGLTIFKLVFNKKGSSVDEVPAAETTTSAAPAPIANNNDEIIAVITAAIAMAESECGNAKFRVVSFRRI